MTTPGPAQQMRSLAGPGSPAGRASPAGPGPTSPAQEVLAALVDPTRRHLLDLLAARGEATATTLAGELPVTRQAVVKHLAALDRAGLVDGHRQGREVRYRVRPDRLTATARWMEQIAAQWDARLAAIKRIAEAQAPPPA